MSISLQSLCGVSSNMCFLRTTICSQSSGLDESTLVQWQVKRVSSDNYVTIRNIVFCYVLYCHVSTDLIIMYTIRSITNVNCTREQSNMVMVVLYIVYMVMIITTNCSISNKAMQLLLRKTCQHTDTNKDICWVDVPGIVLYNIIIIIKWTNESPGVIGEWGGGVGL